jgi:NADH-quinone oxidoreductase subunit L
VVAVSLKKKCGWMVYGLRPMTSVQPDPLVPSLWPIHEMLSGKYFLDELYDFALVRPAKWVSEVVAFRWIDRALIDGTLHAIAGAAMRVGAGARWFDKWGINYPPDRLGDGVKASGNSFRVIQTGRVQDYLLITLSAVIAVGGVFFLVLR